jgi:hypothetical protein
MAANKLTQMEGMFLIIERSNIKGLKHWGEELEKRGIPAVILIEGSTIDKNFDVIKNLSEKGFEIGGGYNEQPLWKQSYKFQYAQMSRIKDKLQSCINRPMRVFHSKFFAYDEVTLRVADEFGVEYILARGTAGAKAEVYKPKEYNAKILSVSNVPSEEMGTGSLCDESLWCRGVTPGGFKEILFGLKEDKIILVAQTHLSGVKLHWWDVYQDFFNTYTITWKSLDEFAANPIVLPNAEIGINTEVKYVTPQPKIPLEQELDYPFEEP